MNGPILDKRILVLGDHVLKPGALAATPGAWRLALQSYVSL